jgi:hypothetical protein
MEMAKGFDCAQALTQAVAERFRADGFEFVCRYVVPSGWKRLTRQEAEAVSAAGLQIVSVYETTASRALGGRRAGLLDGVTAAEAARSLGQPKGSRIYFAVDFDAAPDQLKTVVDYIRAASEVTPDYRTGVYGSAAVVEAVMSAQACSGFWQTYAWSKGRRIGGIHLYQYDNGPSGLGKPMHGINVDLDEAQGDVGWWSTNPPAVPLPAEEAGKELEEHMLAKEDANKIIGFLKAAYAAVEIAEAQDEFHRLATELRKASGQPEEE